MRTHTIRGALLRRAQDGTFSVSDFSEAFQEHEVQRVLRAYPDTVSTDIHCDASSGLWSGLPDKPFARCSKIRINPADVLDADSEHVNAFVGKPTNSGLPLRLY